MTAKGIYEAVLTELNKAEAPSFTLEDFNYLCNKAINLYINRKYNIYDVNQQTTDDLRVLKATTILTPVKAEVYKDGSYDGAIDGDDVTLMNSLYGAVYEVNLPDDYLHILNCVCVYLVVGLNYKCYDKNTYVRFGAKRLTGDMWSEIINNFYMRPQYNRPYYYIHNVNTSTEISTNPITLDDLSNVKSGTDFSGSSSSSSGSSSSSSGSSSSSSSTSLKFKYTTANSISTTDFSTFEYTDGQSTLSKTYNLTVDEKYYLIFLLPSGHTVSKITNTDGTQIDISILNKGTCTVDNTLYNVYTVTTSPRVELINEEIIIYFK